jgi:hypothetical protein
VSNPQQGEEALVGRKLVLTVLVLALGLSFPIAEAKKAAAGPAVYTVKGTLVVSGTPAQFHGTGVLCLSPTCKVSSTKTKFDFVGKVTQKMGTRCLGIGYAGLTIFWPNGTQSWAYLDFIPVTGHSITAVGSVLTGARKRAKVVATLLANQDPCTRPAALSGALAISS